MSYGTDVYERGLELRGYGSIIEQVDRLHPVLQLIQGSQNTMTREELLSTVSMQVALLEADPGLNYTACAGGVTTARAPGNHSFMVHLWAASVPQLQLALETKVRREKDA